MDLIPIDNEQDVKDLLKDLVEKINEIVDHING